MAAEKPDFWPAQNDLALAYNNQGSMRFPLGGDPKAARMFHRKALEVFRNRARLDPANFENKQTLGLTLYYEATCALHSGDKDGADAGYRECLKIFKELATEPTAKLQKAYLMLALARCGDHAGAATIAEALVKIPPKDEAIYVQAACGFALAAAPPARPAAATRRSFSTTSRGPSIACATPRTEAGPTSWASRPIPTSNRSARTRHSKPCSVSSGKRWKKGGEAGGMWF